MFRNDDQIKQLLPYLDAVECLIEYLQHKEAELSDEFTDLAVRALFDKAVIGSAYQRYGALKFVSGLKARLLQLRETGQ